MPAEVLAHIFEIFKLVHNEDVRDYQDHYEETPEVLVSHVSSYFRAVAISTPTLWCQVSINCASTLDQTETYLSRSSGCPLDVRVQLFSESLGERNRLNSLLDLVLPHSHRWRSLSVFQGLEDIDHPLLTRLCEALAPNLKHLTIEVEDVNGVMEEFVDQDVSLPQIFKSVSGNASGSLEFVRLRGVAMNYFRPPLSQTTTLHLEQLKLVPIQYRTFRAMLTTPHNLTSLSVSGDIIPAGHWPLKYALIPLPHLLSLRICSVSGELYARLLLALDAPRLRSLCLKDVQDSDLDGLWDNKCAVTPTFSSVERISFLNFELSPSTFEKLCLMFPNIRTFRTFHSPVETCQFVYLVLAKPREQQGRPNILWPSLRHVSFLEGNEGTCDKRIAQFIDSRQVDGYPLSSLTLLTNADNEGESLAYQSGVKIQLSSVIEAWPDSGSSFLDLDDHWCSLGR